MLLGKTILVVDDEASLRELLSLELSSHGALILEAAHGGFAIEILQKTPVVDLIISDVKMPMVSGGDLLDWVRREKPSIPIVLITGYSDMTVAESLRRGACCVLAKPIDWGALAPTVSGLINGIS